MQVLPGVDQISVNYKNRPLKLYLLRGSKIAMLMDTGDASTPESDILPYFSSIGFDAGKLTHVMATHPDVDHTGGLFRMQQAAPNAKFVCGAADRTEVESPEGLIEIRMRAHYHYHGIGMDDAAKEKFLPRAGGPVKIAQVFEGGETLAFDTGKNLEIMHLPGHSHGHLGVFLPWENAAIIGDAVHGTANRFLDDRAAFACTYMYIDAYLGTIARLRAMKLDKLFSCHWPDCHSNAEVNAFLDASSHYAEQAEKVILETVKKAGKDGLTLRDICVQAKPALGDWPAEKDLETRSMACGHLQHLVANGILRSTEMPPIRYIFEPTWKGLK